MPIARAPEPPSEDRRVRRTRQLLRNALLTLMQEKSYDSITVSEILERADVGRSTFYTHYRDKEDLLVSGYDDIRAALAAQRGSTSARDGSTPVFEPLRVVFAHAETYRQVARQVTRIDGALPEAAGKLLRELTEALVREDLRQHFDALADPLSIESATQFLVGGLVSLLIWWSVHDVDYGAEEMFEVYKTLATCGTSDYLPSP